MNLAGPLSIVLAVVAVLVIDEDASWPAVTFGAVLGWAAVRAGTNVYFWWAVGRKYNSPAEAWPWNWRILFGFRIYGQWNLERILSARGVAESPCK